MNVKKAVDTLSSVLSGVVGLAVTLIGVFLLVDVLFPGTTNIVSNVAGLVNTFTSNGLVGLITLVVFAAIFSD